MGRRRHAAFVNSYDIAPFDPTLALVAPTSNDPSYGELAKRLQAEEQRVGPAGLKQIRNAVAALWQTIVSDEGGDPQVAEAIATFDATLDPDRWNAHEEGVNHLASHGAFEE